MPVHSDEQRAAVRAQVAGGAPATPPGAETPPLTDPLAGPLSRWSGESTWDIWADPELDLKTRSLVTVGILTTLGVAGPLAVHVRGALRNGARPEEVIQVVMHVAVYAGVSRAVESMNVVIPAIQAYAREASQQ